MLYPFSVDNKILEGQARIESFTYSFINFQSNCSYSSSLLLDNDHNVPKLLLISNIILI